LRSDLIFQDLTPRRQEKPQWNDHRASTHEIPPSACRILKGTPRKAQATSRWFWTTAFSRPDASWARRNPVSARVDRGYRAEPVSRTGSRHGLAEGREEGRSLYEFNFLAISPISAGVLAMWAPAVCRAATLLATLPMPRWTMAPAWPMRLPSGVLRPAI